MTKQNDANPEETKEWLEALRSVISEEGMDRANFIIKRLSTDISRSGQSTLSTIVNTPYCNTLAPENEERMPGDMFMERQIRAIVRWNALAMVMRANERNPGIGVIFQLLPRQRRFMMSVSIIFSRDQIKIMKVI